MDEERLNLVIHVLRSPIMSVPKYRDEIRSILSSTVQEAVSDELRFSGIF
jgi:hypothetical protein